MEHAIELRHITKTFGSVVANRDVSLSVRKGEILSLLGFHFFYGLCYNGGQAITC